MDYKFYTNPVAAHPDDWSVAIAIEYKNWSTLDEMGDRRGRLRKSIMAAARPLLDAAKKRNEIASTLSTSLAREVTLKSPIEERVGEPPDWGGFAVWRP